MEGEHDLAGAVVKLDAGTSSAIRKGQVIAKISDVVRELVDNSIDAGSASVQVLLNNFGLDKIEVRDTGHGISPSDFRNAVAGGYTSKLKNVQHASCGKSYGFRGEAISSICSFAFVSVVTKTINEPQATKYVLDKASTVVSESKVAYTDGTAVTVERIFSNFPVRRQWAQEKKRCTTEINDIETYLKAIAIANPQSHVSFYHNGSLIWTKAAVPTTEQAIMTVLGNKFAKQLIRCGPVNVHVEEDEQRKRTLEAFLLKKPVDMKAMSFTSNKVTMILVNRKRVYIREFEKLIQRYVAAVVEKPAPADQRRFPVAVLNINVPSDEADFNRDMDKSKLFLVHKEELHKKLEEVLINFYGIDLRESSTTKPKALEDTDSGFKDPSEYENSSKTKDQHLIVRTEEKNIQDNVLKSPVIEVHSLLEPQKRKETILAFLDNIPSASLSNFSQSPVKEAPVSVNFPKSNPPLNGPDKTSMNQAARGITISNFDIDIDGWSWTQTQGETVESGAITTTDQEQQQGPVHIKDWVHGRITDANGSLIESVRFLLSDFADKEIIYLSAKSDKRNPNGPTLDNVTIVNRPPTTRESYGAEEESSQHWPNVSLKQPVKSSAPNPNTSFRSKIGSGFRQTSLDEVEIDCSAAKRPKLTDDGKSRTPGNDSQPGISFSSARQVTLGSYKNWKVPGNRLTQPNFNAPTGVRFPLFNTSMRSSTSTSRRNGNAIGIPSKSIREYWDKDKACSNSVGLVGLRKSVNLQPNLTSVSPSSSQGLSGSKLIGEIPGTEYYAAKVQDFVGVFSPMSMLHLYPSLKYDLKISFEKLSPSTEEQPKPTTTQYAVSKDGVAKLFDEFLSVVDRSSNVFSEIFHVLNDLQDFHKDKFSSAA